MGGNAGSGRWRHLPPGVKQNGDRAVVDQAHLHVGGKDTTFRRLARAGFKFLQEGFIEGHCFFWVGGLHKTGPVAPAGVTQQGELADDQQSPVDGPDIVVHLPRVVRENLSCTILLASHSAAAGVSPVLESLATTTRRGLPGRSYWHGWVRSFHWRVPAAAVISG